MGKHVNPVTQQILAEGTHTERNLDRNETRKQAMKLADTMPISEPDRIMFVRNLTMKALTGKIDKDVFKEVIKLTGTWTELETCLPRVKLIVGRR